MIDAAREIEHGEYRAFHRAMLNARQIAFSERGEWVDCRSCDGTGGEDIDDWSHSSGHVSYSRRCGACGGRRGSIMLPEEIDSGLDYEQHWHCTGATPEQDAETGCSYCSSGERIARGTAAA
jgi:hypothetical protein